MNDLASFTLKVAVRVTATGEILAPVVIALSGERFARPEERLSQSRLAGLAV